MNNIVNHYQILEELSSILAEDVRRKNLIMLATLRVLIVSQTKKSPRKGNENVEELKMKINEYELNNNKLKQDHSTTLKLQYAKLEAAKQEIIKLKEQLKTKQVPGLTLPNSSLFRSKEPFKVSTSRSIVSPRRITELSNSILTPIQKGKTMKPSYITSKSFGNLLSKANAESKLSTLREDKSDAKSTEPKLLEPAKSTEPKLLEPSKSTELKLLESTPSSRHSFMENFDKSSGSNSPSPDFTPTRTEARNILPFSLDNKESVESKLHNVSQTDDDTFASANSSLQPDEKDKKKKKKKLQLWKSEASKLDLAPEKRATSFGLDDENINPLNYYQDENFNEDGDSPPKSSRKRKLDELSPAPETFKRKKKNIFTID